MDRNAGLEQELQRWRERVLSGVLWAVCSALGIALTLYVALGAIRFARTLEPIFATLLLLAALQKRVPYRARSGLLLALLYVIGITALTRAGFGPNVPVLFETSVLVSALLLGERWGLAMAILSAGSFPAIWMLQRSGALDSLAIQSLFVPVTPNDVRGILRITVTYVVLSATSVVAVSYLLNRAEGSLAATSRALEELRLEQTEADRLRDELRRQAEAFSKARELEVLGRLAGSVAHDFNNALLIIQGNADLVRHDPELLPSALDDIDAAVQQAASTTRQLRGLWHQPAVTPMRLELREAVLRTAKLLRRLLPSNIAVQTEADTDIFVTADEGRLQGLLTNLALNARDAMREGGMLALRVRVATDNEVEDVGLDGHFALMEVQDNGCGMSRETQARLFEPYFTTKGNEGTGLGLASAKAVVEGHDGRIVVSSELGRGTTLRIFWPLAAEVAGGREDEAAAPARRQATILVVEDNPRVRSAVAGALAQRGFTVLAASDGADALVVAQRHLGKIDLLCSDCVMPGAPVRQLVERFRRAHPSARVILCSGYSPQDVGAPLELIDAFVPKPFAPDALAATIDDLVHGTNPRGTINGAPARSAEGKGAPEIASQAGGNAVGRQGVLRAAVGDSTERAAAERSLQESEERFRKLAEAAFEGVAITEGGRFVDASPRMAEILGAPLPQLLGRPVSDFVARESREKVALHIRSGSEEPYEHMALRADGTVFPVEVQAKAIAFHGRAMRVTALRDISIRKRIEEHLRLAQRMETVGRLAGGIAHDFNNLLTVILSSARLLIEAPRSENEREDLAQLEAAAERAAELTRQLLAFARRQVVEPETVDLNSLAANLEPMLRRIIGAEIDLATFPGPQLGAVLADPGQVEQVLINLAVNARDAMERGGRLTIETANATLDEAYASRHPEVLAGDYVMVSVSDTGIGMDRETMTHIFEPFFTTKEPGKGTGLGLATCYGIVRQAGGFIWVYSEPGKGTTFKVYFARRAASPTACESVSPVASVRGHETILVVDDEPMVRRIAIRTLKAQGYTVHAAADGREALQRFDELDGNIDLLVTDLIMPGRTGKELADELHCRRPNLKVLFTSGYTENTVVHQGIVEAGVHFLGKPYVPTELARRVREVIDAR
jgi:two-component system cell cycle sensor histidine kinase/response regulator CckA